MPVTKLPSVLSSDQQKYAVESGIAIAPQKAIASKYPFLSMEIGDSFALQSDTHREALNVRAAMSAFNKNHAPMKFVLRLNRATGTYRCWRIA